MKIAIFSFLLFASSSTFAQRTDEVRYSKLFERQELIHRSYRDRFLDLTDINKQDSLRMWYRLLLQNPSYVRVFNEASMRSTPILQGKDYRFLYFYFAATGQIQQASQTVGLYLLSSHTVLDNFSNNPQAHAWNEILFQEFKNTLSPFNLREIRNVEECIAGRLTALGIRRQFEVENFTKANGVLNECAGEFPIFADLNLKLNRLFKTEKFPGAPYPISYMGFVGGNEVHLNTEVPQSPYTILNLGEQLNLMTTSLSPLPGKLYSQLTIEEFKQIMPTPESAIEDLFTRKEGFKNTINWDSLYDVDHITLGPVSGKYLGIYGEILQSIRNAKESVFIDIFWMGGSIGMNLAKELFKKVIDNPDFTVVVISDRENKFQYGLELDMVYHYMRAFSEKFTDKNFYVTPANISLKRTALPEFIDLLITNNTVNNLHSQDNIKEILNKDGFNLLAKSDHTKVVITDGKNPENGIAFVGSKNWTDSSGGVNYDEVAAIHGPATALILNSFYYDALEAFDLDLDARLGGSMVNNHITAKFPGMQKRKAAEKLLAPIDVIHRSSSMSYNVPYVAKGDATIAPAQNNIYGTEMSAVEQNIQMILNAKHQVVIDDQFLYDPRVIAALKVAKQQHGVNVYVMMESLIYTTQEGQSGTHIPNILFVPELVELGIQVKWQITPPEILAAILEDNARHPNQMITATFHLKSLTVDGVLEKNADSCNSESGWIDETDSVPALVTGSANKDVMTMSGGFREYQVAIFDKKTVALHDCTFWSRWNSDTVTQASDGLDFELPPQAAQMGITDKKVFLNLLKQLFFTPYNFTKDLF